VPDGVELPPDDLIEGLEKALVKGEILDVHLVGAPEFLEAGVHGSEDGGLDAPHGRRHGDADVDHVRRGALQVCGGEDVEAGPEMEAPDVEALHGTLGLGETGDHGVGAVREGVDGEKMALAEEAGDEGVRGGIGGAVGGEEEEGPDVGGVEAGGEEVGGESARGEEEGGARGIKGGALLGGEVGGHVLDLQPGLEAAADPGLEGVRGREDEEASSARRVARGRVQV